jgi:hypothetical protein
VDCSIVPFPFAFRASVCFLLVSLWLAYWILLLVDRQMVRHGIDRPRWSAVTMLIFIGMLLSSYVSQSMATDSTTNTIGAQTEPSTATIPTPASSSTGTRMANEEEESEEEEAIRLERELRCSRAREKLDQGALLKIFGRFDEARDLLTIALNMCNSSAETHFRLGEVYLGLNLPLLVSHFTLSLFDDTYCCNRQKNRFIVHCCLIHFVQYMIGILSNYGKLSAMQKPHNK